MIVLSQRKRLNLKADNTMVSLHGVMHDNRDVKMIVEHYFAESLKLAYRNMFSVVWLQLLIVFVS